MRIPWTDFVPVKRAQSDPTEGPLDASAISKFGLVLSRFEFNKMPNPSYKPGGCAVGVSVVVDVGVSVVVDVRQRQRSHPGLLKWRSRRVWMRGVVSGVCCHTTGSCHTCGKLVYLYTLSHTNAHHPPLSRPPRPLYPRPPQVRSPCRLMEASRPSRLLAQQWWQFHQQVRTHERSHTLHLHLHRHIACK